jgi:hypothetical protein
MRNLGNGIDTSIGNSLKAWISYTPTFTAQTGAIFALTVNHCVYQRYGKTVMVNLSFTITNNGTAAGALRFTLPFIAERVSGGIGFGRETAITGNMLQVSLQGTDRNNGVIQTFNNNYSGGTNTIQSVTVVYEAD